MYMLVESWKIAVAFKKLITFNVMRKVHKSI